MVVSEDDVKVPAGARALIVSRSVATDRYTEPTPTYTTGAQMQSGATIPLERTETPVDFDQVLTALNEFSVGIAGSKGTAEAVRRFLKISAKTFGPHGQDMNRAITSLGDAVNGISEQREDIVGTMSSLDELATELVQNRAVVQSFLDSVAATTALLASERANFRRALVKLSRTVEVVATFAQENKAKLKGTVADVADVSDILLARRKQVEEFIELMPLVAQNLVRIRVPSGVLIRAPLADILGGDSLNALCKQLPVDVCQFVGVDPTGPLVDLIEQLIGPGGSQP